ncbi:MAG: transporter [Acidobacteria bacterium]|nr:transporter [Acidobacteriota bacterium]
MTQPPCVYILAYRYIFRLPPQLNRTLAARLVAYLACALLAMLTGMGVQANAAAPAQSLADSPKQSSVAAAIQEKPIQDNSFLIEEAYNQEAGVVQHINFLKRSWGGDGWEYTFTQEWPFPGGARHQFSYTLPVVRSGELPGSGAGLGDFLLNYRYQLSGGGNSRLAFSPRLSLVLPSGDSKRGYGYGSAAVQGNLPVSLVLNRRWVMHINAGTTVAPRAQNEFGDRALAAESNIGQSLIWLLHPKVNLMLEAVWNSSASVIAPDKTERSHEFFLSPGIRWAHDFGNGLQIVPGLGVAFRVGSSAGQKALVLYLSFEHP